MQAKHNTLNATPSNDSEGPLIIIHDTSTGSESESSDSVSNDKLRRPQTIGPSGSDSVKSSSTEFTSEGGESEGEKRSVSPSPSGTLIDFLEKSFSDEGLSNDLFLLKHVRRHRHGFVSLKLLAGFKEAKKLNCDWHSLSLAAKQSTLLEVSGDGRKVRRKLSLPDTLVNVPSSRYLAAVNLSQDLMTIERLASTFSKYGSILSLHLIKHKPGGGIPEELQPLAARVPEAAYTTCALIQYEDVWGVSKALKEFSSTKTSLHIFYNQKRSFRSSSPTTTSAPTHHNYRYKQQQKRKDYYDTEWRKRIFYQNRRDSTGSEAEEFDARIRNLRVSDRNPRPSLPNINAIHKQSNESYSLPNSPKMQRKYVTKGVLRNPIGPNGTRGFHHNY